MISYFWNWLNCIKAVECIVFNRCLKQTALIVLETNMYCMSWSLKNSYNSPVLSIWWKHWGVWWLLLGTLLNAHLPENQSFLVEHESFWFLQHAWLNLGVQQTTRHLEKASYRQCCNLSDMPKPHICLLAIYIL